jgi:uncharacterized Zn finger protein
MRWDDWDYFPPRSVPRQAKGGIKAQSKKGAFAKNWWAQRWLAVLENFNLGNRLYRGRSYARRGQVLSIDIRKGKVLSSVQGSSTTPYKVSITMKGLQVKDWKKMADAISAQAIYAAKLLNGEMPQDIETIFDQKKIALFPRRLADLKTECSCPDWSNPCKHIAAVFYLIGEEFDRDPFLLFRLRGIDRDEILSMLRDPEFAGSGQQDPSFPAQPLSEDLSVFWKGESGTESVLSEVKTPPIPAALPKRLGHFPFWRGNIPFLDTMHQIYKTISEECIAELREEHGE